MAKKDQAAKLRTKYKQELKARRDAEKADNVAKKQKIFDEMEAVVNFGFLSYAECVNSFKEDGTIRGENDLVNGSLFKMKINQSLIDDLADEDFIITVDSTNTLLDIVLVNDTV